jgi:hypothetical protein
MDFPEMLYMFLLRQGVINVPQHHWFATLSTSGHPRNEHGMASGRFLDGETLFGWLNG